MPQTVLPDHSADFEKWLAKFAACHKKTTTRDLQIIDRAAWILNDCYTSTITGKVRPHMQSNGSLIDRHKIASAMEMAVMHVKPIRSSDQIDATHYNANFAFFVGSTVIRGWCSEKKIPDDLWILPEFEREHITWLRQPKGDGFPIFSNAASWYLYERVVFERHGLSKNQPSTPAA